MRRNRGGECQIHNMVSLASGRQQLPDRKKPVGACVLPRRNSLLDEWCYWNIRLRMTPRLSEQGWPMTITAPLKGAAR